MANLTRWDPFNEMLTLRQAMDRLFEDAWVSPWAARSHANGDGRTTGLPVDLYETGDDLVLTATVPGVKPEDIDITIQGEMLTIKGEFNSEDKVEEGSYHRHERRSGSFYRQVALPSAVKSDAAEASFEHGVLKLRLPKADEAKERKIPVTGTTSTPQIEQAA